MLRLLEEGELFQSGDKMLSPITGEFSDIPANWIENKFKFSHKDDNTLSRMKIQVVRKIQTKEENLNSAELTKIVELVKPIVWAYNHGKPTLNKDLKALALYCNVSSLPEGETNKTHEEICEYIYDEDSDSWDSKCGYNIEDEHTCRRAKFCQYCGRKLHHA